MICNINKHGLLSIRAETELEAYALQKWILDNCKPAQVNLYEGETKITLSAGNTNLVTNLMMDWGLEDQDKCCDAEEVK